MNAFFRYTRKSNGQLPKSVLLLNFLTKSSVSLFVFFSYDVICKFALFEDPRITKPDSHFVSVPIHLAQNSLAL